MLEITIDCNNDQIIFDGVVMPCKHPTNVQQIILELLNRLDPVQNVLLIQLDEDQRTIVAEW